MITLLYHLGIHIYELIFSVVGLWNAKASKILAGRKNQTAKIEAWRTKQTDKLIWFHVASLGEYESASIFIDEVIDKTNKAVLVSFYSPSGYENFNPKNDRIFKAYLPKDTMAKMSNFVKLIRPEAVVFVKYEFWYKLLSILSTSSIPFYYVDIRPKSMGLATKFSTFKKRIANANLIYHSTKVKAKTLQDLGFTNIQLAAQPSKIRVGLDRHKTVSSLEYLSDLEAQLFILGSVYQRDIPLIQELINALPDWVFIVAPHEVEDVNIRRFAKSLNTTQYYSKRNKISLAQRVLIVDTIGDLKRIYQYASACYIGGNEQDGFHNYYEAAVHGIPVFHQTTEHVLIDGLTFGVSRTEEITNQLRPSALMKFKQNNMDIVHDKFTLDMKDYALMMNQLLAE